MWPTAAFGYSFTMPTDSTVSRASLAEIISSTVSQLFEPQMQKKNRRFHVPQPTFLFPLETPLRLSRNVCMDGKAVQCLPNPSSM